MWRKARVFFSTPDGRNRYAILHLIHAAMKAETRAKRAGRFVHMAEKEGKIYP
jgi:uncharacterized protein YdeI (YjbR/CyaY-like superfamily)